MAFNWAMNAAIETGLSRFSVRSFNRARNSRAALRPSRRRIPPREARARKRLLVHAHGLSISKATERLVRDAKDHFSHGVAGFHVGDGLGRGFQRKGLVQDRLDDALVHQRSEALQLLAARAHEQVLETHAPFPSS